MRSHFSHLAHLVVDVTAQGLNLRVENGVHVVTTNRRLKLVCDVSAERATTWHLSPACTE
jgi:hypothetical protein